MSSSAKAEDPATLVGRFHRDALVYVIGDGTVEIQRNIIARSFG